MKIVVTGATGNVGTALVRHLLATGDHEVVGVARRLPTAGQRGEGVSWDRVGWSRTDLTRDESLESLRWAFRGADAVVHLAWGFQPSHDPTYLQELGVGGTRRVLQTAIAERVPHLVHMSSVGAYSPKTDDRPVDETYPTDGIPTSVYSSHKAAAERILDVHEASPAAADGPRITRLRPGIIGQRAAGSALLRYGVPGLVPGRALPLIPVLPLDRRLLLPVVHADDVADAIGRALTQGRYGAFNLASHPAITPQHIARALGSRTVHVPAPVLRAGVTGSWRARLQPLDPGWLDLGMQVPLLDTTRARDELGWFPSYDAESVLGEVIGGLRDSAAAPTPVLRPRSVTRQLTDRIRHGPITRRPRP